MSCSNHSRSSVKPDTLTFFGKEGSRESSIEDVVLRSRSISSVSNFSNPCYPKPSAFGASKKYFNLAALDGFAMIEDDEGAFKINNTVCKGMDVDGICEENNDYQNKTYHLDKLFNANGPYSSQLVRSKGSKRNKKQRKKSVCFQRNYLSRIDDTLYQEDLDEIANYGTKALFEDPEEKEIRMAELINRNKLVKDRYPAKKFKPREREASFNIGVSHLPFRHYAKEVAVQTDENFKEIEEDKIPNDDHNMNEAQQKSHNEVILDRKDLLNLFKDHEILNAFKLSLLNTNLDDSSYTNDSFFENVGKNFINLLRQKADSSEDGLTSRLDSMNLQSDQSHEITVVSDFGDIIPANVDTSTQSARKHQKWTIGEHKKLQGLIGSKPIHDITEEEWNDIASKLDRTKTSVYYKAKELCKTSLNVNKKRKITENRMPSFHETQSAFSSSKFEHEFNTEIMHSEQDFTDNDFTKEVKSEGLSISRKKAIEAVLEDMPGRCGSKINIFKAISQRFDIDLSDSTCQDYKGFQQCLCKYFKTEKGFYALKLNSHEYHDLGKQLRSIENCKSWKEKTFFILNQFPNKRARIDEIKEWGRRLINLSSNDKNKSVDSNLAVWEKNLLKTLSRHDGIFDSSNAKAVYYIR